MSHKVKGGRRCPASYRSPWNVDDVDKFQLFSYASTVVVGRRKRILKHADSHTSLQGVRAIIRHAQRLACICYSSLQEVEEGPFAVPFDTVEDSSMAN